MLVSNYLLNGNELTKKPCLNMPSQLFNLLKTGIGRAVGVVVFHPPIVILVHLG